MSSSNSRNQFQNIFEIKTNFKTGQNDQSRTGTHCEELPGTSSRDNLLFASLSDPDQANCQAGLWCSDWWMELQDVLGITVGTALHGTDCLTVCFLSVYAQELLWSGSRSQFYPLLSSQDQDQDHL